MLRAGSTEPAGRIWPTGRTLLTPDIVHECCHCVQGCIYSISNNGSVLGASQFWDENINSIVTVTKHGSITRPSNISDHLGTVVWTHERDQPFLWKLNLTEPPTKFSSDCVDEL